MQLKTKNIVNLVVKPYRQSVFSVWILTSAVEIAMEER